MLRKEIVRRAIEFAGPQRVPICYFNRDLDKSDTYMTGYSAAADFSPAVPEQSEWGYIWKRTDDTMGQPHGYPLADSFAIAAYVPPDPFARERLDHLANDIRQHGDRFVKFGMGITGFNQATFLRGFEDFLMDMHCDLDLANWVLDIVFDFENSIIRQLHDFPLDAVVFGDDWGTQQDLMIAPELWRRVFKQRYEEQFDLVHQSGKKVWFHSCGNIYSIIGDMIDIGVDVLELLQPDLLGIERLGRDFGGKVCFCCSIDHQTHAISGARDEIFVYARSLNENLGAFGGGFIAYIEDYSSLGMSEQNYQWICEAFHGLM